MSTPPSPKLESHRALRSPPRPAATGFTLTELLVVIVVIAMLATLLLPALANTRADTQAFQCQNHLRQLQQGWLMYAGDHNDRLVANANNSGLGWVLGNDISSLVGVTNGMLWPFVRTHEAYMCPADESRHFRSVSMNAWIGSADNPPYNVAGGGDPRGRVFLKLSDFSGAAITSKIFALIDEGSTINDGFFINDAINGTAQPNTWVDIPATFHNAAAGLVFADGHTEIKNWHDPAVLRQAGVFQSAGESPPNDLRWLQTRSSVLR